MEPTAFTPGPVLTRPESPSIVLAVAYSPDGSLLASAGEDKRIELRDAGSGQPLASLDGHADAVACLAFSPDGRTLASASRDGTVKLWDVPAPATSSSAER